MNKAINVKEIIDYLNQHVISQNEAKKRLAVLLKNKERYEKIEDLDWKKNITPFNALIIGPTGSGKTELFRKLAEYIDVAFCKVDISGYTKAGYVGKDVEDIISVHLYESAKKKAIDTLRKEIEHDIKEHIIKELAAAYIEEYADELKSDNTKNTIVGAALFTESTEKINDIMNEMKSIVERIKDNDPEIIEKEVSIVRYEYDIPKGAIIPKEAREMFKTEKIYRDKIKNLIPMLLELDILEYVKKHHKIKNLIRQYMENGIVFIDEIDKIAGKDNSRIEAAGVQKELLTLVEGTTVMTEVGPIKTDHILFIAAGAFHTAKPSDLLPELLGRFPVRIVLKELSLEDYKQILTKPKYSLIKKIQKLYETENIILKFTDDAIEEIAKIAYDLNINDENLGARRLQSVLHLITEDIDFEIIREDVNERIEFVIDRKYVVNKFKEKEDKINEALEYLRKDSKERRIGFAV